MVPDPVASPDRVMVWFAVKVPLAQPTVVSRPLLEQMFPLEPRAVDVNVAAFTPKDTSSPPALVFVMLEVTVIGAVKVMIFACVAARVTALDPLVVASPLSSDAAYADPPRTSPDNVLAVFVPPLAIGTTLLYVVAKLPAVVVTSPVSAGNAPEGSVPLVNWPAFNAVRSDPLSPGRNPEPVV